MSDINSVDQLYRLLTEHYQAQIDHTAQTDKLTATRDSGNKAATAQRDKQRSESSEKRDQATSAAKTQELTWIKEANATAQAIGELTEQLTRLTEPFGNQQRPVPQKLDEPPRAALQQRLQTLQVLRSSLKDAFRELEKTRARQRRNATILTVMIIITILGGSAATYGYINYQQNNSGTATRAGTETAITFPGSNAVMLALYAQIRNGTPVKKSVRGISMVLVPPGCFLMGSDKNTDPTVNPDEAPQHKVCLTQGYYIGEFEVTNAQYEAYETATGKNRAVVTDECKSASSAPDQPVVCVSWDEANAFATTWMGNTCGLPTEAQWEYAARGPASLIYPWGNAFDQAKANTGGSGLGKTAPVGTYPGGKSWVGAQDLDGNVWEWVNDWYSDSYYAQRVKDDPTGPTAGSSRSLRGGSWNINSVIARAASRGYNYPFDRFLSIGFRVVCSAPVP